MKAFETNPLASSTGKIYSTLSVTVLIRRRPEWFIQNIFIPTLGFLIISALTFTYGDDNRSERNDVSMNTMLASIAYK